jgi:hypothetical protein
MQSHTQSTPTAIDIELLAIDLNTCTRCTGTLDNIEKAIDTVRPVLEIMNVPVKVHKRVIQSEAEALEHQFAISPTVRINGQDIAFEAIESKCDACTDLCGCEQGTDCRIWPYQGTEHTEAPVGLVVESILALIFGNRSISEMDSPKYQGVPENLQRFFAGMSNTEGCCSAEKQQSCCEQTEKATCCEEAEPASCGCQ